MDKKLKDILRHVSWHNALNGPHGYRQRVTEFVRSVFYVISIDLSRFEPFGRLVLVSRIGRKPWDVDMDDGAQRN